MTQLIDDPSVVSNLASQVMQEAVDVKTVPPSSSEVELPGGFIDSGSLVKYVEIRELNGADEEAIAKAGSTAKALNEILQRGLVKVGGRPAKQSDFDEMLLGDRDAVLLGIRKITFGDRVPVNIPCSGCGSMREVVVDLNTDIPVKELEDPINDRRFEVTLKVGTALVSLPNGLTQRKLMDNNDKTASELATVIIAGCLSSINGTPISYGTKTALELSIKDRESIVAEIADRNPGPRLGGVVKACEACGSDLFVPLSLADLFRL